MDETIRERVNAKKREIDKYIELVRVLFTLQVRFRERYGVSVFVEPTITYEGKGRKTPDILVITSSDTALIIDHKYIGTSNVNTVRSQLEDIGKYYGTILWRGKNYKVTHVILLCNEESWQNVINVGVYVAKPISLIYEFHEDTMTIKLRIMVPKDIKIIDPFLKRLYNVLKSHRELNLEVPIEESHKYVFIRQEPPEEYIMDRLYRLLYSLMEYNVDKKPFRIKDIVEYFKQYHPPWVLERGEAVQFTLGRIIKGIKLLEKIDLAKYYPKEGIVVVKKIKRLSSPELLDHLLIKLAKYELKEEAKIKSKGKQTRLTNFFH